MIQYIKRSEGKHLLGGKVDGLGVAPALDVENAIIRPDMLVVADELAFWIGRKRTGNQEEDLVKYKPNAPKRGQKNSRLASSRKAEEKSDIALFHTDIGRRMQ